MDEETSAIRRSFVNTKRSWYAQPSIANGLYENDEVMIYLESDSSAYEISVLWHRLGDVSTPRLEAFDDAWAGFAHMTDVFSAMARLDGQNISAASFCQVLGDLGFEDVTKVEPPDTVSQQLKSRSPSL